MVDLDTILRLETLVVGCSVIIAEIAMMVRLERKDRLQWHYHAIPLADGMAILASLVWWDVVEVQTFAFAMVVATATNMYNVYVPQIYMAHQHIDVDTSVSANLIEDLLVPRYKKSFRPWGPVLYFLYSLGVIFHIAIRCVVFARTCLR